ncbi:hypothetical protein, partial [Pandoraea sp. SD6-2]|uniref:hypothetical protein n=1 Tax=Pandoraea sp. SD6-2 TaxID=1286093 RepID=UPI00033036E5
DAAVKPAVDAAVKLAVDAAVKPAVDAAVKPAVDAAVRTATNDATAGIKDTVLNDLEKGLPGKILGQLKSPDFEPALVAATTGRKLLHAYDADAELGKQGHVNFTLDGAYTDFEVEFSNVRTNQDNGVYFGLQVSRDNGKNWVTTGYALSQLEDRGMANGKADTELHSLNASALTLQGELSAQASTSISGRIRLVQPHKNGVFHHFLMDSISTLKTGEHVRTEGGGVLIGSTDSYNAIQLFFYPAGGKATGNIEAGRFRLYGLTSSVSGK